MATIPVDLFVDNEGNTLLYNQYGGTPVIPALVAGDTLACSVYYFDRGSGSSPYRGHRYESAATTVRLRAWGNNDVYATGDNGAEIAPAMGAVVTTSINGGGSTIGKKHVEFGSEPFTGYFTLTFTAPTTCRGNDPANQGMRTVHGTTGPIHITATAAEIAAAINALSWQKYDEHGDKVGSLYSPLDFPEAAFVISGLDATGFDIEYGTSLYSGNGGTMVNPQCYQLVPPGVALPVVNMGNVEFKFGWSVSVPLTDADFTDLFLVGNAPAYLEVLLTPSGEGQVYAAQYQIESGGSGGSPPPTDPPVGGGGESEGGLASGIIIYDGDYSVASAIDGVRVELPFPHNPEDRIYRQTYEQFGPPIWSPLALDSECPHDATAFLVEETEHQSTRIARVVQWDRVWARVPSARIEYESNYPYPYQQGYIADSYGYMVSESLSRLAKVTYSYFHTTNPAGISIARLPRLVIVNGVMTFLDGFVNVNAGETTIARDDTLRRWMGNIWEKTHTTIVI